MGVLRFCLCEWGGDAETVSHAEKERKKRYLEEESGGEKGTQRRKKALARPGLEHNHGMRIRAPGETNG